VANPAPLIHLHLNDYGASRIFYLLKWHASYRSEAVPITRPTLPKHWMKHKEMTPNTGLASSFLHPKQVYRTHIQLLFNRLSSLQILQVWLSLQNTTFANNWNNFWQAVYILKFFYRKLLTSNQICGIHFQEERAQFLNSSALTGRRISWKTCYRPSWSRSDRWPCRGRWSCRSSADVKRGQSSPTATDTACCECCSGLCSSTTGSAAQTHRHLQFSVFLL